MSLEIQKQIKDNSSDVQDYFKDLFRWTESQEKNEKRREGKPTVTHVHSEKPKTVTASLQKDVVIARDALPMPQYYNSWETFDADGEVQRLEEEEVARQEAENRVREADRDRALDDQLLNSKNGERQRTSKARPLVKVSVRASNRRVSNVDLAAPKKEEANRLLGQGKYLEAVVTYTKGLEYLVRYKPPDPVDVAGDDTVLPGDMAGEESEAVSLKTALLANRALALMKLERWRECVEDCTEALSFNPEHHKATLRRGFAYARLKRWKVSARDLKRAVHGDVRDTKAATELRMVQRMLFEKVNQTREHAKAVMTDPTRVATLPMRKLRVQARSQQVDENASVLDATPCLVPAARRDHAHLVDCQVPDEREPYVPRSVRMRGSSCAVPNSGASTVSLSPMTFCAFEIQWMRNQQRPMDRFEQLKKVGAKALPALFRESLDGELVASITSTLLTGMDADSHEVVPFACAVLQALTKTPRFELSVRSLSAVERSVCDQVFALIKTRAGTSDMLAGLMDAYLAGSPMRPSENQARSDEGNDGDAVRQGFAVTTDSLEMQLSEGPSHGPPPCVVFSLDSCD